MILAPQPTDQPAIPPPAVGSWVDYSWEMPKQPKSRIRFAVVDGDDSGRRRIEIVIVKGTQLARFGYDMLADGTRTRQVAQLGDKGAVLLMPEMKMSLPELPKMDQPKKTPPPTKKWKKIKVPAGTFRCQEVVSVQGVACVDPSLMPMTIVRFEGKAAGRMILMRRGFDAKPEILGTPRPLPQLDPSAIPSTMGAPNVKSP